MAAPGGAPLWRALPAQGLPQCECPKGGSALFGTSDEWLQSSTAADERPPSAVQRDPAASMIVSSKAGAVVTSHEEPHDSAVAGAWLVETETMIREARRYEVYTFT